MKFAILLISLLSFLSTCNNSSTKTTDKTKKWISIQKTNSSKFILINENTISTGDVPENELSYLENVDVSTFEIWKNSDYARDKNRVYYPINFTCIEFENGDGMCFYDEYVVENANPNTFEYLGKEYAKDDKSFFFKGKLLENIDEKTIQELIAK